MRYYLKIIHLILLKITLLESWEVNTLLIQHLFKKSFEYLNQIGLNQVYQNEYLYLPAPGPNSGPQFVFTGPGPRLVFTGAGPQFLLTGPGLQFVFNSPGLEFVFTGPGPNLCLAALAPNLYLLVLASHLLSTSSGQDFTTITAATCSITTTTITTTITTTATSTTRDNNNKRFLRGSKIHMKWPLKDICWKSQVLF